MNSLDELLERVKAATGPDRDLDADIATWQHPHLAECERRPNGGWNSSVWGLIAPPELYTSSLDSALALVERVLPGWWWAVGHCGPHGLSTANVSADGKKHGPDSEAATPALALLAALLSALIARDHIVPKERVPQGNSGRAPKPQDLSARDQ